MMDAPFILIVHLLRPNDETECLKAFLPGGSIVILSDFAKKKQYLTSLLCMYII